MRYTRIRLFDSFFALIRRGIERAIEYNQLKQGNYFSEPEIVKKFMIHWTLFSMNWSFVGDIQLRLRSLYFEKIRNFELPSGIQWPNTDENISFIDYAVKIEDGEWELWKNRVQSVDLPTQGVSRSDVVIQTVDTLRHQEVLCSWLIENKPFIICGPPGSGKTMTLMSTLKNLNDFELRFVNFSSSTTPELILKQFERYCEYAHAVSGTTLRPKLPNKTLILFCDEINLPSVDSYGTQKIITFLRQLTEQKGF